MAKEVVRQTYTLLEPIEFGSQTIAELKIRKPKAGDMLGLPADGMKLMDDVLLLLGRVSGQPMEIIKELSIEDLEGVSTLLQTFMATSLVIGSAPSQ